MSANLQVDVLVVGGGINGASIALDAAGRGLSVILCEQDDIASGTSSWSSKLIHGGLRYLEHYDFKLVRHALQEREVWLERAPHLIKPLEFILPHEQHLRPRWMLRIGLWLYDHLAKRKRIPNSKAIVQTHPALSQLKGIDSGFSYYDCFCDDSRLVVETIKSASDYGAKIYTRTKLVSSEIKDQQWLCELKGDHNCIVSAKTLVNATGPWVDDVSSEIIKQQQFNIQLVKGSHIVVQKLYDGDHAYILQNEDQRIVFAIPYQQDFTLIGTTDVAYQGDPKQAHISQQEVEYLLDISNRYFQQQISRDDIVWQFSGVRPLFADDAAAPSKMSRDYRCVLTTSPAPLVTILGGKLTTARVLAEDAVNLLKPLFPAMQPAWTKTAPLSGGQSVTQEQMKPYHFVPKAQLKRMLNLYGSNITTVLADINSAEQLGHIDEHGLYACEIKYFICHEWAKTQMDILWRRSKQGLVNSKFSSATE